jgi:hydroxyethylthiazole kinase-like uncharacterized protein yjeF
MKVSRVSEMHTMDRAAIEQFGIVGELLMENAGHAAFSVLAKEVGITGRRILVFCGIGNNGGDGFVIARKIHSAGGEVQVLLVGDRRKFEGAAKMNLEIISRLPIDVHQVENIESIKSASSHCDVIVDAIFGTGLTRDVEGLHRDVIELINGSGKKVLSVDIPSGVHGDTGQVRGAAIKADYTVTLGLPKVGNLLFPGYELCGKLYVSHISFPPALYGSDSLKLEINLPPELPPRKRDGHRGFFGEVLFIAGAPSYLGAPYFAALSFMRAGGGCSRLATPWYITPFIANKASEIVYIPQKETETGTISHGNKRSLIELSEKMNMVVLGPGLSLEEETQQLARELAREVRKPLLIDGDGITAVCKDLRVIKERKAETILTPHLGEMSRITGKTIGEVEAGKTEILQQTARELNATIVLKGAHSLIGYADERVFVNMSGNSGMATAGSGDVLTGTIAAMFCLGLSLGDAVRKGVFIHGLAGDLAAEAKGEDGITAQDILEYLPYAVKADREGLNESLSTRYAGAYVIP